MHGIIVNTQLTLWDRLFPRLFPLFQMLRDTYRYTFYQKSSECIQAIVTKSISASPEHKQYQKGDKSHKYAYIFSLRIRTVAVTGTTCTFATLLSPPFFNWLYFAPFLFFHLESLSFSLLFLIPLRITSIIPFLFNNSSISTSRPSFNPPLSS